jgi:hypothetical protein
MERHYSRSNENYSNGNINPQDTVLNYNLASGVDVLKTLRSSPEASETVSGKKVRKERS